MQQALGFFQMAEDDYSRIELTASQHDVQYYIAMMYHNLGMIERRDEAADKWQATREKMVKWEAENIDPQFREVMDVVVQVGEMIANRQ